MDDTTTNGFAVAVFWGLLFMLGGGVWWLIDMQRNRWKRNFFDVLYALILIFPGCILLWSINDWPKFIKEVILLGATVAK